MPSLLTEPRRPAAVRESPHAPWYVVGTVCIASNNTSIMAAAPQGYAGLTGGLLNMTRGAGTALGVALAGALYLAGGFTLAMAALGTAGLLAGAALKRAAVPRAPCPARGRGPKWA